MPCCTLAGSSPVGHAEQVAEGQHAAAGFGRHAGRQVEVRQVRGVDLEHGQLQPRIGAQQLGLELAAVVERDRDVVGVEHVAPDGQDVSLGGDQKAALIRLQAAHAAGAVDLDDLRLIRVDHFGKRIGRRGVTDRDVGCEHGNRSTAASAATQCQRRDAQPGR